MAQTYTKNYIVNKMLDQGYRANDIDQALSAFGYSNYDPLTNINNYKQLGSNLIRNAKDMYRDFKTLTGQAIRPIQDIADSPLPQIPGKVKDAFINAVNNPTTGRIVAGAGTGAIAGNVIPGFGAVPGAIAGGLIGAVGPKAYGNAMLDPYHITIDDIKNRQVDPRDIVQGIFENPLYATLDIGSLGGAKVLKGGINKIDRAERPAFIRQIAPSKQDRQVQRFITDNIVNNRTQASNMYKGYNSLDAMVGGNREEMIKFIISNKGNLTKQERRVAKEIRNNLRAGEKEAIEYGYLSPLETKTNTVAQYIMSQLGDRYPNLLHDDIVTFINNSTSPQKKLNLFKGTDNEALYKDLTKYMGEGNKLYDDKKIAYLTQAIVKSEDPQGIVKASELNKGAKGYFDTRRIIGRSTAKDIAPKLEESIKYQLDQINTALEVEKTVNNFLKDETLAREVVTDVKGIEDASSNAIRLQDLDKSKYSVIDPDLLSKNLKEAFRSGNTNDIHKAISKAIVNNQGGFAVDKMYLRSLENSLKPTVNTASRKLLNSFKKAVLANPHWIVLNRIGNLTNNLMEGVDFADYADAISKYKNLLPRRLAQQTSFNSYINSLGSRTGKGAIGITLKESVGQPVNKIVKAVKNFHNSDTKDLGKLGDMVADIFSGSSELIANPLFKIESILETTDRYANFIKQAKRLSDQTGEAVESILKRAGDTSEEGMALFNKLNTDVNKSLGDYLGKNYMIPNDWYQMLSDVVPFYRFLTQTGRTTVHQLANNPLAFQSIVMSPTKLGKPISEDIINTFGLDEEKYTGGYPYKAVYDNAGKISNLRTVGLEPLPIASALTNPSIASPLYSIGADISNFQRMGRKATSPTQTILREIGRKDLADKYEPTGSERLQNARDIFLSTFHNPYRWITTYAPEAKTSVMRSFDKGEGLQSRYNAVPLSQLMMSNPETYMRWRPSELTGKWFGIQTNSNYPKRTTRINNKRTVRNREYQKRKEQQARQK